MFVEIKEDLEPIFMVDGKECYLEELSSGFKSILSIIFSIVDWIEGVNDGELRLIENACGTVLIDEVDVHLHPEWQAKIMDILRVFFPKLQFIVTTHSPYVIASAKPNEVIKISRIEDDMELSPLPQSFAAWQLQDIVNELMGMPPIQRNHLTPVLKELDKAYRSHNLEQYDVSLAKLISMVSQNDVIVKEYQFRRGNLILDI